ncbi:MAG: T9SS C-terminal target domain-containing protein [Candidatus Zixiibacteriota bacterium]|nr:MAG: T9SS C-terminal target domain-containing protein [candidate division Zixibacteria bacterium]
MRRLLVLPVLLAGAAALATPYIPPDKITVHQGQTCYEVPPADATWNHYAEYLQICAFQQPLQCEDPGSNFGGQREEETGWMYSVIETDNTLEAIQVWSRYRELTNNPQYDDEIQDAWTYSYAWPAWLEGMGYYSYHNCAWALAAERQFRETFGDSTHWNYAVQSANYMLTTTLGFSSVLNVMVTGWGCGNLYLYGEATGNQAYMDYACMRAQEIINWVAIDPANRLSQESWAMSSGTFVWGICNSLFRRDPALGQQWIATYGPLVQVYEPAAAGWSNAWNVAYCNAQGAMHDVSGNPVYAENHLKLANLLLSRDLDNDGGIPASAAGSSDVDASWVTSYLALMGCDHYMGLPADAGVLMVLSPRTYTSVNLGQPVTVRAAVGNWGIQALPQVMVTVEGAVQDTLWVDLPAGSNTAVDFGPWTPTVAGIDSLWVTVHAPGDTVAFNNTDISRFRVRAPVEAEAGGPSQPVLLTSGPGNMIAWELPQPGWSRLTLYNLRGQLVETLANGHYPQGITRLPRNFPALSNGIYFLCLETAYGASSLKFAIVK